MKRGPFSLSITSMMALGAMMQPIEPINNRVKPLPNVPDHRPNAKKWTCKRCVEKFTPHRSPTYCDRCQSERMDEHRQGPEKITRQGARDALITISQSGIPVHPLHARKLYEIAEWPLPEHLKPLDVTPIDRNVMLDVERKIFGKGDFNADSN